MKLAGIYKIQSIVKPKKIYIGSAIDISDETRKKISDSAKQRWILRKAKLSIVNSN